MVRRLSWFELVLTLVFLSATLFSVFSDAYNLPNTWFIRDDAYYYFKVAQNISEGRGSTFDGIHPTNGYHPLWLAVCIPIFALARYDLILPLRLLAAFTGVLQLATSILLYRLVRSTISEMAGILAACFWAFNTYVLVFLYKTGVESSITLFLLLLLLHGLRKLEMNWRKNEPDLRTIAGLALISVLIAFGRLDLAFFSLIVGIWIVFRATPARYLLPLDILAFACAAVSAFLVRLGFVAYYDISASVQVMLFAALACKVPILYFMGLYTKPTVGGVWRYLGRLLLGVTAGSITLAIILLGGTSLGLFPVFSRAVLLLDLFISLGLLLVIRLGALAFGLRHSKAQAETPNTELRMHWKRWLREGVALLWHRRRRTVCLYAVEQDRVWHGISCKRPDQALVGHVHPQHLRFSRHFVAHVLCGQSVQRFQCLGAAHQPP